MVAGCLLVLQIVLGARLKCLDRIFGLNKVFSWHRISGIALAPLVLAHPVLIFISDDRIFIPLQWRYWPEFVGLILLLLLIFMVISSNWRVALRLPFHRWQPIHRSGAILAVLGFGVHVLSVNDTFEHELPGWLFYGALGLCGLLFIWIGTRPLRGGRNLFSVSSIEKVGADAICLKMVSKNRLPAFVPGQFGFIAVIDSRISKEEHPFTIASSPAECNAIEFIVRTTGDWTGLLETLAPGSRILFDGPFGLFSHLQADSQQELIMIAGGIGVTPMLSMLRHMADHNDRRKITLLWSNQTPGRMIMPHAFEKLAKQLEGLRLVHLMTRVADYTGEKGRLDRFKLKQLLSGCSRSSAVFVCGPDQLMKDIRSHLVRIGFRRRLIYMERFSL